MAVQDSWKEWHTGSLSGPGCFSTGRSTRARPKYVVEQPTKPYSLTPFLPTRHHPEQNEGEGGVEIVYAPESTPRKQNIQSTTSYFLSPFGLQRGRRAAPTWSEPLSSALAGTKARPHAGRPRRAFCGRSGRITSRWRPTNAPHFTERCGPMQHKRKQCFGAAWGAASPSDQNVARENPPTELHVRAWIV